MKEAQVLALLPNGLTKVDLGNSERKQFLFPKGFLDGIARDCIRADRIANGLNPDNGLPNQPDGDL